MDSITSSVFTRQTLPDAGAVPLLDFLTSTTHGSLQTRTLFRAARLRLNCRGPAQCFDNADIEVTQCWYWRRAEVILERSLPESNVCQSDQSERDVIASWLSTMSRPDLNGVHMVGARATWCMDADPSSSRSQPPMC